MSVSSIICRGYGSFGSVNKLPTLGYSQAQVQGGGRTVASAYFVQGAQSSATLTQGAQRSTTFVQGCQASATL